MQGDISLPSGMSGWQIEELVGEGSYGVVYKVSKEVGGRTFYSAVKVIDIPGSDTDYEQVAAELRDEQSIRAYYKNLVDEYINEIELMDRLKGEPHIVAAGDYEVEERTDEFGWRIFIRMEFLTSFAAYMKENEITEDNILQLGTDICAALTVCEKAGVIHRDIKPDNVFITKLGEYKLGDFGVAKHLEGTRNASSVKGSKAFMAPEVLRGVSYDKRVDIYSLGMMMYKLLNRNRDPFVDPTAQMVYHGDREAALMSRMEGKALPAPIDAPKELARIILKACAFKPNDRYSSAKAMQDDLEKYKLLKAKRDKKDKTGNDSAKLGSLRTAGNTGYTGNAASGKHPLKNAAIAAACFVVGVVLALGIVNLMQKKQGPQETAGIQAETKAAEMAATETTVAETKAPETTVAETKADEAAAAVDQAETSAAQTETAAQDEDDMPEPAPDGYEAGDASDYASDDTADDASNDTSDADSSQNAGTSSGNYPAQQIFYDLSGILQDENARDLYQDLGDLFGEIEGARGN